MSLSSRCTIPGRSTPPMEESPFRIQFNTRGDITISDSDRSKILKKYDNFLHRYGDFLGHGEMTVGFKRQGTRQKGNNNPKFECSINLWCKIGQFNTESQDFFLLKVFDETMNSLEKVVQEEISKMKENR